MPSIFTLLPGNKQKRTTLQVTRDNGTAKELLVIDATMQQTFTGKAEPTDNPVEQGSNVTDNVDVKPLEFSMEGVISESPITLEAALIGNVAGVIGGVVGRGTSSPLAGAVATGALAALGGALFGAANNRVRDAYNTLEEIRTKGIPVTIITGLRTYNNMVLRNFVVNRIASTGRSLSFTAAFKEIRIVTSLVIKLPKEAIDEAIKASGSPESDLGKQNTSEADESLSDKFRSKSALKILFGS